MSEITDQAEALLTEKNPEAWTKITKALIRLVATELEIEKPKIQCSKFFTTSEIGPARVTFFMQGEETILLTVADLDRELNPTERNIWAQTVLRGKPKRVIAQIGLSLVTWATKISDPSTECVELLKLIETKTRKSKRVGVMEKFRNAVEPWSKNV